MNFNKESLQYRFRELTAMRDAAFKEIEPLQAQYDEIRRQEGELRDKRLPIEQALNEAKQPIAEMDAEKAMIHGALRSKTGPAYIEGETFEFQKKPKRAKA